MSNDQRVIKKWGAKATAIIDWEKVDIMPTFIKTKRIAEIANREQKAYKVKIVSDQANRVPLKNKLRRQNQKHTILQVKVFGQGDRIVEKAIKYEQKWDLETSWGWNQKTLRLKI